MKKIYRALITILIVIGIVIIGYILFNQKKEYSRNIYYMDTYIYIKIYSNQTKAKEALDNVELIYKEYHELSDRYHHYDNITNVYDIKNNDSDDNLVLNDKLYNLLTYASDWHKKYNKYNIEMGNIIDVWKKYRDSGIGIPSYDELDSANKITNLVLLGNNTILNNHPNLDLGSITKGYATEEAGKYLESIGINEYLINAGGNVKVGKSYGKDYYNIGIQSPKKDGNLLTKVKGNNISVITSGSYERFYEYDGNIYHHIIDPDTLMPSNYMKSVTVITQDSALGDVLSTVLFLNSVDDGLNIIKEYDVEAIWYTNDDNIIRSDGFNSYE